MVVRVVTFQVVWKKQTMAANTFTIEKLREKYLDLVWYARAPRDGRQKKVTLQAARHRHPDTPEDILQGLLEQAQRIERMYPDEVAKLNDRNADNWDHGFNSGMLAALRLIPNSTRISNQAQSEFPMLHS